MSYPSVEQSTARVRAYHDATQPAQSSPSLPYPVVRADVSQKSSGAITWTLVSPAHSRARSVGVAQEFVGTSQHDDMTAIPDSYSHKLRMVRDWSNYGVSTGRALGHWIGGATGAVFGFGVGGITGLMKSRTGSNVSAEQTLQASLLDIGQRAITGLRVGTDTGVWVGGQVASMLVNVVTLGAPKVIDYLDRSFNGE